MNRIVFAEKYAAPFDAKWHTHEDWALICCTGGQGVLHFQDGSSIPCRAGTVLAVPPGVSHTISGETGASGISLLLRNPAYAYKTAFSVQDETGSLLHAFTEAYTYYSSSFERKELILSALGALITGYLIVFRSNGEFTESVAKIRNQILRSYTSTDFSLDDYIRTLPFHYDYLRKLFKKETGLSPLDYLTALRMEHAQRLLSTNRSLPVAEIARMCGYENALYFSRVFKKHCGCAPSQFASRQRQNHAPEPGRGEVLRKD